MQKRIYAAALASAAIAASMLAAPTAHAEDQRPCVSKREYRGAIRTDQQHLENRWEVVGKGRRNPGVITPPPGYYAKFYPACGFNRAEAWVAVEYKADTHRAVLFIRFKGLRATLHGHP